MRRTKLTATDQAKAVRELTQHVREATSEVSEQDVGETTRRRNDRKPNKTRNKNSLATLQHQEKSLPSISLRFHGETYMLSKQSLFLQCHQTVHAVKRTNGKKYWAIIKWAEDDLNRMLRIMQIDETVIYRGEGRGR